MMHLFHRKPSFIYGKIPLRNDLKMVMVSSFLSEKKMFHKP